MFVYIPFCHEMLETLPDNTESKLTKMRATRIDIFHKAWVVLDLNINVWTYFEVDVNSPGDFNWHVGTYEDFTALLMIQDMSVRYEYAHAFCKIYKVRRGEAQIF